MISSSRASGSTQTPGHPVLHRKVRVARLSILIERVWEALLWPAVVAGLFIAFSMLGLFTVMPGWLHLAALVVFGFGLLLSLRPIYGLRLPAREDALRRLERDAGVKHRPATSYEDTLAESASLEGRALWEAHRARLAALFARLKPRWPRPRNDQADPYALRIGLALVLIVALVATGAVGLDRIRAAFTPQSIGSAEELRVDAWITPPAYTKKPPVVLASGSLDESAAEPAPAISVPEKSVLLARAHLADGGGVQLRWTDADGAVQAVTPKPRPQGAERAPLEFEHALTRTTVMTLVSGTETLARWDVQVVADQPPRIALMDPPTRTPRGSVRLGYAAEDDYGVVGAEARFRLADAKTGATVFGDETIVEPPLMPITLPGSGKPYVEGHAHKDLTAHPWAGLKVSMTLSARDHSGQRGESDPHEFILPEREFTKPLAKALVAERRKLVLAPERAQSVADELDRIAQAAAGQLTDADVYLSLRSVYWRLRHDQSADAMRSAIDQLWQLALKIEFGDLPEAERNLQAAQERLMEALKNNASDEEIERLVEELRTALNEFLKQMQQQQAQRSGEPQPPQVQSENGDQMVSQQDLDKLLDAIEQLAKSGSKDMAERMLAEMRDVLERLQNGNMAQNAQAQQMAKTMQELQEMIGEQQKLLDETFEQRRQQPGGEGQEGEKQGMEEFDPDGQPGDPFGMEGFMGQDSPFGQFGMNQFGRKPGDSMSPGQGQQGQAQRGQRQGQQGQQGRGQGQSQSRQAGRGGQAGQQGFGQLAQRQAQLRQRLEQMMQQMRGMGGKPPEELDSAGAAMGDAQGAISEQNLERATQQQTLALDRLREGAQSMADQMMQAQGQQQQGQRQGQRGPGRNGTRDPLGRPERSQGPDLGLSVEVPDEIDVQRAREILEEVRRRLGDPSRPDIELDYLERLIRQF